MVCILAALGSILSIPPKNSEEKIVNVAKVNQQHCLKEREQWLENVDRTRQVLAAGKLVIQKSLVTNLQNQGPSRGTASLFPFITKP